MSDTAGAIDCLPLRFRDEHEPVPMVRDFDQLGDIIETRIKPGLTELLATIDLDTVEYAGYALATYFFPQQRLDFQFPDLANSLNDAMVGMDRAITSGPQPKKQDLYIDFNDSFDLKAMARLSPEDWREGYFPQGESEGQWLSGTFSDTMFVLGSLVRTYREGRSPRDQYNQPEDMHFSLEHAVAVGGDVLLPGLYGLYPELREGWDIPDGYTPELLTLMFDLNAIDTTWLDYHVGLENYWMNHPHPRNCRAPQLGNDI